MASGTLASEENSKLRDGSASPLARAAAPMATMMISPVSSMIVRTTLTFTDSEIPRKLINATTAMNSSEAITVGLSMNSAR
jgi:hypothetical protein